MNDVMKKFILSILAFLSPILFTGCDCDINRLLTNLTVGGGDLSCTINGEHYERSASRVSCSYFTFEGSERVTLTFSVRLSTSLNGPERYSFGMRINALKPLEPNKRYEPFSPEWSREEFPCYNATVGTLKCLGGWVEFQKIPYPINPKDNYTYIKGTFEVDVERNDGSILHIRQGTFDIPCTIHHMRQE